MALGSNPFPGLTYFSALRISWPPEFSWWPNWLLGKAKITWKKTKSSVYREQFHKNACFISKYVLLAFNLILGTLAYFTLQLGEQLSLEDPTSAKYTCHHKLVHSKLANATKFLLNIFIPLKSILINGLKKDRFSRNKHLVAGNEPTTNQLQSNSANHKTTTPSQQQDLTMMGFHQT